MAGVTSYTLPGQVLAAEGYAVVYPNYRGSTGRGVSFSKLDQHDYAEEEFNDLVDAKRHLVEEGPGRCGSCWNHWRVLRRLCEHVECQCAH